MDTKQKFEMLGLTWYEWLNDGTSGQLIIDFVEKFGISIEDVNHFYKVINNITDARAFTIHFHKIMSEEAKIMRLRTISTKNNPVFEIFDYLDGKYGLCLYSISDTEASIALEKNVEKEEKEEE